MKYSLILLLILFIQDLTAQSKLTITRVSISSGYELDMVSDLGESYFLQGMKTQDQSELFDLTNFEKNLSEMFCENANFRVGLSMRHDKLRSLELNLAFYKIDDRFDAVEYTFNDAQNSFEGLNYLNYTDEAGLEISFNKLFPILKFFQIYGGLGKQLGYSYNSRLNVIHQKNIFEVTSSDPSNLRSEDVITITESETIMERNYKMKNSLSQKVFLQTGFLISFFDKVELGLMARYGLGNRWFSRDAFLTKLNSFNFTMAYKLT